MMYSLKQAAEAVGRGKPAILRAIQKGIISANRNAKNEWVIDPAELHRVYQPIARNDAQIVQTELDATNNATDILERENVLLREQLEILRDERQDLRHRLDQSEEERRETQGKLTALLTYQPEQKAETSPEPPPKKSRLLEKLFGRDKAKV
jgi:chromosome segregation ATPase